jgi:hypothetical protein
MVYSQIWLNLPKEERHFFCIFLWMIATLAKKQKIPKKTHIATAPKLWYYCKQWIQSCKDMCTTPSSITLIASHIMLHCKVEST